MRKIYGLIGHPVKHSLSAAMHNAAFQALKMDAEYRLFDLPEREVAGFIDAMRLPSSEICGLNVTIPHKITVFELLKNSLSQSASLIGAVNTVVVKQEHGTRILTGDNTDGTGFLTSLREDLRCDPAGKIVFVLGAGGAARAIIMSLGSAPEKIYCSDIDESRANALVADYKKYFDPQRIFCVRQQDIADCVLVADLLINATAVGMHDMDPLPIEPHTLHKNMAVFDVVYNPLETKLLSLARQKNLDCVNGLGMLLYQGVESFKRWTGIEPPLQVMRNALENAIKNIR